MYIDGWMDGYMDRWWVVDEWIDKWMMGGWMSGWIMGGWMLG